MRKTVLILIIMMHFTIWSQVPVGTKHFREDAGILKEIIGNTMPTQTGSNTTLITDRKNQFNKALSLNGDYYQSTLGGNLTGYSVSFFVKTNTNDNSVRSIVDFFSDHGVHLYLANGKINAEVKYKYYYFGTAYVSNYTYHYGINTIDDNQWHNVTYRFRIANANNAYIETFIDGQLDKSSILVITNTTAYGFLGSTINAAIGTKNSNLSGSAHYEDGIDDIKFFNYTLSDAEITKLAFDRDVAKTVYVNKNATGNNDGSSWTDAFTSLTTALNYAVLNNDEIWVAKGIYFPNTSSRSNSFTPKAEIKIFGGFTGNETLLSDRDESLIFGSNATILSGDLNQDDDANITFNNTTRDDNTYNVVTINQNNCTLDGLVIANGYADGTVTNTQYGAGIYKLENVPNLTLKSCKIINNIGYYGAGAYLATNDNSTITIDRCIFENNLASNGASGFYSFLNTTSKTLDFSITNSLFNGNKTANDAVKNRNSIGASAGWIRAYGATTTVNLYLVNNTFVNNLNEGTGANTTFPTFGISQRSSGVMNAVTANNIFFNNKKNGNLAAIAFDIINDVSLGNTTVYNSMDEDSFSSIASGNKFNIITGNPMFYSDFSLLSNSPALDYGDNSKVPAGITKDLYGNVRVQNTNVDIGAVEGFVVLSSETFVNNFLKMYPNPVEDILYVENSLNRNIETIRVIDVTGKVVLEQKGNERNVNLSNLNPGFYMVLITSEGKSTSQKIVKK
jgi:trimeric autotransporter adhesin